MDDVVAAEPAASPAAAPEREIPFEFTGSGAEYFRIWIVNLLLTILTLGIYSAWAKVRRLRYFYGSTRLDGASFEYHGRPIAILKGRLIAVAVYALFYVLTRTMPLAAIALLPVILFGMPWIIVRSRQFHLHMSSWRGLRFRFHGRYGGALGAFVGWPLAGVVTLGLLWPLSLWKRAEFLVANSAFGTQRFEFRGSKGMFYAIVILTGLFSMAPLLILGFVLGLMASFLPDPATLPPEQYFEALLRSGGWLLVLLPGTAALVVSAYYQASILNETWGGVHAGAHRLRSRLRTWPLAGIYITNMLGMLLTLGLFYPWAKVRQVRYQLANTSVLAAGDLDGFTADAGQATDAVGEEIADVFDVDFSL